jgi:hypothetical protein
LVPGSVSVLLGTGGLTTEENTALAISGISVSDIDAGGAPVQVMLTVGHGALALASTMDLTGDLDGTDGTMTLNGSLVAINSALAGLSYEPAANYHGSDTLTVTADDLGHSGSGGALTDMQTLGIAITPDWLV